MKTIIISDIKSKKESVITFGLNLGKELETEVEVIHPVDSRIHQGEYGAVSDSQSVTPGNTFTHKEIIFREKEGVKKELDKLLSAEASRLNYPLKVQVNVENETLDEAIKKAIKNNDKCIFIASNEPDGNVFESKNEILDTIKNNQAVCLLVPPGKPFSSIHKIFIPVDFNSTDIKVFLGLHFFFEEFKPYIVAVDVAANGDYTEKELKSQNWMELAEDILPVSKVGAVVLKGKNYNDTIASYCNRNAPDVLLLSQHKQHPVKEIFSKKGAEEIFYKVNMPVLIHYY